MRAASPFDWRAPQRPRSSSRVLEWIQAFQKFIKILHSKNNTPFDRVVLLDFCLLLFNGESRFAPPNLIQSLKRLVQRCPLTKVAFHHMPGVCRLAPSIQTTCSQFKTAPFLHALTRRLFVPNSQPQPSIETARQCTFPLAKGPVSSVRRATPLFRHRVAPFHRILLYPSSPSMGLPLAQCARPSAPAAPRLPGAAAINVRHVAP
jgi:hypothetical protein